ncbi:MAG: hypothetical protein KJ614_05500 [Gammaproteobacteria bacterium]|uniref:hypothetical protein n=1 Tax=Rhodoferax sp. TaxID=50421 RepID=UPI001801E2B6|nr:hypothetical protein [Rhodoferax sp.]MBU3898373.1 hypothetical protein [Gammaproteobacteria bacterium]MBA3059362.1 hypothetical protein [Rhodoferax sp.]MBU3998092.1 hypothetical protein [Gammaproteobacteria bacterium]MBU4019614.1 hypothetical protein [Gammaproteobacteria bacterium]MBU4079147.1 hypothetical protein [Gammaproteobacteria bacterium]
MTHFRFVPLAAVLTSAALLAACNTAPTTPMGTATAHGMATPDHTAKMDAQMKSMQAMHDKMVSAKTPQERSKLMAEHMKAMQDGMAMMGDMSSAGMGDMKAMPGMTGDMGAHHKMMAKRMQMMQMMMQMMMDRESAAMPMAK